MGNQTPSDRSLVSEDIARTLIPSLLEILEKCHRLGYGHGDLHEGNVMAFLTEIGTHSKFQTVLIDFDNASIKTEVHNASEQEKQMADVRLFKNRLGPYLTMDWKWGRHLAPIYEQYYSFEHLRLGYTTALNFIGVIEKGSVSSDLIKNHLKPLGLYALTGFALKPTFESLQNIANAAGYGSMYDEGFSKFLEHIRNPLNWEDSAEITPVDGRKTKLYIDLFGS